MSVMQLKCDKDTYMSWTSTVPCNKVALNDHTHLKISAKGNSDTYTIKKSFTDHFAS